MDTLGKLVDAINNTVKHNTVYTNITNTTERVINGMQNDSSTATNKQINLNLYTGSNSKFQTDSKIKKTNSRDLVSLTGLTQILRMQGIVTDMEYDKYQRFKRVPLIDVSPDLLRNTKEYIFITKPNLHIYSDKLGTQLNTQFKLQPRFADIQKRYPMILRQLQFDLSLHESPFINLLSYTCQNTMDIQDTNAKEIYSAQNIFGTKINYRGHSKESDQDVSFTLEFRDNDIAEVYTFFRLWDIYENLKSDGIITPPSTQYTQNRVSHDKVGAYKFIVDEIGKLVFWAEWWGVIPDGSPRGSWSETGDTVIHSVNFKADFVDDMDPQILEDFNNVVNPYVNKCPFGTSKMWLPDEIRPNYEPQIVPYIEKYKNDYYIKWRGGTV